MLPSLEIVEVAPRDGLQNESKALSIDTRIELITRLVDAGCRRIEAVSFVHPRLVPQMAGAEEVVAGLPMRQGVSYIGLILNTKGAERAIETTIHELNIVVPVTNEFSIRNQGSTREQMLEHAINSVELARSAGRRVSITLAVAFGCPFHGRVSLTEVRQVLEPLMDLDIDEIAFADTIGIGVPGQVRALAGLVAPMLDGRAIRFHFHNTRNTGYANALVATELAGFDGVSLDASVGGFGGCPFAPRATGNIGTEDLLNAIRGEIELGSKEFSIGGSVQGGEILGIDIERMCEIAEWLSTKLSSPIQSMLPRVR